MKLKKKEKKYEVKGISNSSLSWFEKSPRFFKDNFDNLIEKLEASYLDIGTKTHYYLLEPKKFDELYVYLEYTTPRGDKQKLFCEQFLSLKTKGKKTDKDAAIRAYEKVYAVGKKSKEKIEEEALALHKDLKKYLKYLEASKEYKEVLNYTTLSYLESAKRAVQSHKLAKDLIFTEVSDLIDNPDIDVRTEYNILWDHPFINIGDKPMECSSTIDRMIIDHKNKVIKLVDVKTTYDLSNFSEESFINYKYYRQLAFYWMAIHAMFKKELPSKDIKDYKKETYIVAVQTNSKYNYTIECEVFNISEDYLDRGEREMTPAMKEIAWHFENNLWDHRREYYEGNGAILIK